MKKTALLLMVLLMSTFLSGFSQVLLNEGFEDGLIPPTGWSVVANSPDEGWIGWSTQSTAHSGTWAAYIPYALPSHNSYLITPQLSLSGHKLLSFWYAVDFASDAYNTSLTIEISTSGNATSQFVLLDTMAFPTENLEFINAVIDLGNYTGQNIYIAFHVQDEYGSGVFLDDIMVYDAPDCLSPMDATASNATTHGVTISWTPDAGVSSYVLQYVPNSGNWLNADSISVTGGTALLSGLLSSTTYQARVKAVCGDAGEGTWSNPITFTTLCEPFTVSSNNMWTEDFEYISQQGTFPLPNCWDAAQTSTIYDAPYLTCGWPPASHSGSNSLELKGNTNETNLVVLPQFTNQLNSLRLSFYANTTAYALSNSGTLQIGYITNVDDPTTFTVVQTINPKTESLNRSSMPAYGPYDFIPAMNNQGRIAIRFTSNTYNTSWNFDDIVVSMIPECAEPSLLQTSNVTATSADFFWSAQQNQIYDILYWVTGTTDTFTVSGVYLDNGPINIDTLNPTTSYTWLARAICNDGSYSYSLSNGQFTTPNTSLVLPYTQNFAADAAEITEIEFSGDDLCRWTIGNAVGLADFDSVGSTARSMYISDDQGLSNHYSGNNWSYAYATLNVQFPDAQMEYHLEFDVQVKGEGGWDYFAVYLMDGDDVVPTEGNPSGTALVNGVVNYNSWSHFDLAMTNVSGQAKKIVFYWINDNVIFNNPPVAVDNIYISGTSCARPSQPTLLDLQSEEVTLQWQENGAATSWYIHYKPSNSTTFITQLVDTNVYTLSGLIANTDYACFITALCEDEEESDKSNPIVFRTPCSSNGITVLPYMEDFGTTVTLGASAYDVYVPCWTRLQSNWNHRVYVNSEDFENNCLDFHYTPNCYTIATLPMFNMPLNSLMVSVDVNRQDLTSSQLELGAMSDPYDASTFELISTIPVSSTYVWENHTVFCNEYEGSGQYLAFRVNNGGNNSVTIDNLVVDYLPYCMPVSGLAVSDVSTNSATITWNGEDNESFNLYVTGSTTEVYSVYGTSFTLTGLQPSSSYSVRVQKVCDDDSSEISNPVGILTECDFITITEDNPWGEGFENYVSTSNFIQLSNCWATPLVYPMDNISYPSIYNSPAVAHTGSKAVEMLGNTNMLVLPEFTNDLNTLRISFWANTSTNNADNAGIMQLGYITNVNLPETFTPITTIQATAFNHVGHDSPTADFVGPFDFNMIQPVAGARIALRYNNSSPYVTWDLDDFIVSLIPNCPSPVKNSVEISYVSAEEATIEWTDTYADHDSWEIHYKPTNSDEEAWQTETAYGSTSHTLTGLFSNTQYDVYVTTYCVGSTDSVQDATWIKHFTTTMVPEVLPYSTDFSQGDDWVLHQNSINRWKISNPYPTGNTHALFVTSNGLAPGYDESFYTYITAEKLFVVGDNPEILISFDIKVGGESEGNYDYDFLKLFLAPRTVNYEVDEEETTAPAWASASYSTYAYDFTDYLPYSSGSNVPYKFSLTGGNTIHIEAIMQNPNSNPNPNSVAKLAFAWINDYTAYNEKPGPVITEFSVSAVNCVKPVNLSVDNITMNSVDISWDAISSQYAWVIEYKESSSATWTTIPVLTNSYQLTNLYPGTEYVLRVATDCGDGENSVWATTTFHTHLCESNDQCNYSINMTDSYGDGWNGATVTFMQNGTSVGSYTLNDGYTTQTTVNLCSGLPTTLVWSSGQYDSECSLYLYNADGTQIFNASQPTGGQLYSFTPDCTPVVVECDVPFGILVSSITDSAAYMDWVISGTEQAWVLEYTTDTMGNWMTVDLPYNMYLFENLTPSTTYYVRVKSVCDPNNMSAWSDIVTFTTTGTGTTVVEPEVITQIAIDITENSATLNGAIVTLGNQPIIARGFEWKVSTSSTYQVANVDGIDPILTYTLTSLTPGTHYTYRAFATTANATSYGNERHFTTLASIDTLCQTPINLMAIDTTMEKITLTWGDIAGASSWMIRYRQANEEWTSVIANTNPFSITGLTSQTIYEIQVRAICDENHSSEWTSSIFVSTKGVGIPEYLFNSIVLYPNPAKEIVNVEYSVDNAEFNVTGIEVYDVYGKLINAINVTQNPTSINIADLAAGMYFVRINTNEGTVTKSFVKK